VSAGRRRRRDQRGQSTVELALLLPVVMVLLLLVVQVVLVSRDRVVAVHAVRAAGRAVVVDPREDAALEALAHLGPPASAATVTLRGDRRPGGLLTVAVDVPVRTVPLIGPLIGEVSLREELTVVVEGDP
jgi:Flp pilus assembly protein TadG